MIQLRQITNADEILALNDYYTLSVQGDTTSEDSDGISSIAMMHVLDGEIINEAVIPIEQDAEEGSAYSEEKVASGLSRLLIGSTVVSEPMDLSCLRKLLDRLGYEGEISFVPSAKLAKALFPDLEAETPEQIAGQLGLEVNEPDAALRSVTLLNALFRICRREMGGSVPETAVREESSAPAEGRSRKEVQKRKTASDKNRISTKTLKRVSENIWKTSPWVLVAAAAVILIVVVMLILPKKENTVVDRNEAPVNYLVLSWNETGKYGTKPKAGSGDSDAVQFRIPYGVYNVLNNNSIPVEVEIIKEGADLAKLKAADNEIETASELSAGSSGSEDEEENLKSEYTKVTIRPNSSRQITIDEEQYLTLSEDADNLVFFYLSPVPEEPESDTTGQISSMQSVVYAYVKGTEVRFRKAPSLEGQIIDSLNDGQQVQVLAITGEWTHVQVGDQKGYIFSQYLSSDDPAATKKPETAESADKEGAAAASASTPKPTETAATATTTDSAATSASSSTTASSGDKPSNAIENSPLANSKVSSAADDVVISETGPTGDGSVEAQSTAVSTNTTNQGKLSNPSEIAVPANENPTDAAPTAEEG
ncbi:MAG: SH3 domain-containing protein [Oscillospiraceae bacterium]|nr:SH3 domain-containing protein [Oscillospiraceae bacterium]